MEWPSLPLNKIFKILEKIIEAKVVVIIYGERGGGW
jgi:hypothetical protein